MVVDPYIADHNSQPWHVQRHVQHLRNGFGCQGLPAARRAVEQEDGVVALAVIPWR